MSLTPSSVLSRRLTEMRNDEVIDREVKEVVRRYYSRNDVITNWGDKVNRMPLAKSELDHVVNELIDYSGKKILDVGTGGGRFALSLAKCGDIYGVDLSLEMLRAFVNKAEQEQVRAVVYQADAENLPFKKETFDIALCMATITVCPNPEKVILEMNRVLKPGGIIVVSITNKLSLPTLGTITPNIYKFITGKPVEYRTYMAYQMVKLFRHAGLSVRKIDRMRLFGSGVSIPFTRKISMPIVPQFFANWFFKNIEVRLKLHKTPLKYFMNYIIIVGNKAVNHL